MRDLPITAIPQAIVDLHPYPLASGLLRIWNILDGIWRGLIPAPTALPFLHWQQCRKPAMV
jgi:hypothetical protein